MKTLLLLLLLVLQLDASTQQILNRPVKLQHYEVDGNRVDIYFYDHLEQLIEHYPGFRELSDKQQFNMFDSMLVNNPVYNFIVTDKKGRVIHYAVHGDPVKHNTAARYQLIIGNGDITKHDFTDTLAVIRTFGLRGEFFDNMKLFNRKPFKGREVIQLWGMFWPVTPLERVKNTMNYFIRCDRDSLISAYHKEKNKPRVAPLFSYQDCAIQKIKSRTFAITVNRFDQHGKMQHDRREEISNYIYQSAVDSNDMMGVTGLPYFDSSDELIVTSRPDSFLLRTNQTYLRHYLENIYVIKSQDNNQVIRMGGTLLIHGYSVKGHSVHKEIYRCEFAPFSDCWLPAKVNYYYSDDSLLKNPRLEVDVRYTFK